ncbi:MAG: hypothetical protein ACYC6N_27725 [Pirellulaceae bacterium]
MLVHHDPAVARRWLVTRLRLDGSRPISKLGLLVPLAALHDGQDVPGVPTMETHHPGSFRPMAICGALLSNE